MTGKSLQKIFAAGFVLYRDRWDSNGGSIWYATQGGNWKLFEKGFKTKVGVQRRITEIVETDPKALIEH